MFITVIVCFVVEKGNGAPNWASGVECSRSQCCSGWYELAPCKELFAPINLLCVVNFTVIIRRSQTSGKSAMPQFLWLLLDLKHW